MAKIKRTDEYKKQCLEIGKRLKYLREFNKLRLKDVEDLSNNIITIPMLSNYEKGKKLPSLITLKHIAKIYHTTADYIIFGNNPDKEMFSNYGEIIGCLEGIKKTLKNTCCIELIPDSKEKPAFLNIKIDDADVCLFYNKLKCFEKIKEVIGPDGYYKNVRDLVSEYKNINTDKSCKTIKGLIKNIDY